MKILYLDFLYPEGHIRQNTEYINCLAKFSEVCVLCEKGRYDNAVLQAEIIQSDCFNIKEGRLLSRISTLKVMLYSAMIARKKKPDYIFVSSYETITFAIGRLFFSKRDKLFLLQHFNIDELENGIKRCFFNNYMRTVDHIVFEKFISDYLIEVFNLDEKRIHVLPYQLNENSSEKNKKKTYSCVGLSNSNDEKIISAIVDIENRQEILKGTRSKVILKSKSIEFDNGFLKVINGYLDNEQYDEYINNSQCIYMPFPSSFRYRMSGTLVDALSNNKIVLGSNIPLIVYYAAQYPKVCKIVSGAEDLFENILKINMLAKKEQISDFERFKTAHSENKIMEALDSIFSVKE